MAQTASEIELIMMITGHDSPEELDPYEVERLENLLEDPVDINLSSRSRLLSTGLLSRYQVASLIDYRMRHGDVLSFAELAAVDGFGEDFVEILRHFVSLRSFGLPGQSSLAHGALRNDIAVRGACKLTGSVNDFNYGLKYKGEMAGKFYASLAATRPYDSANGYPEIYSGSIAWEFLKARAKIIAGDFNARFGQGLALWNGIFMTSLTSPEVFMKKPSGISTTWSYTGSSAMTGAAAELAIGRWTISALCALPGIKTLPSSPEDFGFMPAVNAAWHGRHGQCSMTNVARYMPAGDGFSMKTSIDGAFCIKGTNLYGEAAYDWKSRIVSAVAGTDFKAGEDMRLAMLFRMLPEELYGAAFSGRHKMGERYTGLFSFDGAYYTESKDDNVKHSIQMKAQISGDLKMGDSFVLKYRVQERVRTWGHPFRTDMRTDLTYANGPVLCTMRLNALKCDGWGFVSYVEEGFKNESLSVYLREGLFFVDDWDDRIYVYERDAPGSFTVPAMYGRGLWTSLAAAWRISPAARLYARAAYTAYPFMPASKKKPGKAELKLQMVFRF